MKEKYLTTMAKKSKKKGEKRETLSILSLFVFHTFAVLYKCVFSLGHTQK
jgi:hypothetical protein